MKNLIETQLTAEDRADIDKAINDLENVIKDKLVALTEEERVKYGSINEQNKLLVNKVREHHQTDPSKSSPDVNWEQFDSDYDSRGFLESRSERIDSISYRMRSTKILHDYDNYHDSLNQYSYTNYKRGAGEPGYTERAAELKQFFPKSSKNKPPEGGDNS